MLPYFFYLSEAFVLILKIGLGFYVVALKMCSSVMWKQKFCTILFIIYVLWGILGISIPPKRVEVVLIFAQLEKEERYCQLSLNFV